MRIRKRAMLLGLLPTTLLAMLLGSYLSYARLADLDASMRARGSALSRHLGLSVEYGVISGNTGYLNGLLKAGLAEPDVAFIRVRGMHGAVLAQSGRAPRDLPAVPEGSTQGLHDHWRFSAPVDLRPQPITQDPFLPNPVETQPHRIAWVDVVLSREGYRATRDGMLLTSLIIVALGLAFATLLVFRLALTGMQPIMDMIAAVRRIAAGDLSVRVAETARSELRDLQEGINQMGASLQSLHEDMQGRVREATLQLARQKEAAETANAAKSKFLAAASHDLRQPMQAIALYVAAMKPQLAGREVEQTLGKIELSVATMESLFNAILDISKLDAGVVMPHMQPVSAVALLDGLAGDFRMEAAAKGLKLRFRASPVYLASDPVLLGRILRNLVANALRYTERGGVLVSVRERRGKACIQVWDSGAGIAVEHLAHVFQEFFQIDNPQRDRAHGLGLGLAIVDRLARLLGYPLSVRSVLGRGTVFSLEAPLADPASLPPALEERPALDQLGGRVLVLDDEPAALDALVTLLSVWGLQVVAAASSDAALALLDVSPAAPPDLLISDYRLAGETGLEAWARVKNTFRLDALPAIIITGDTGQEALREIAESDAYLLHKPVAPAKLRALMRRLRR
ncbi:MAG: ATP-binding protein [Pseudomonadota bacterium]|nr:ATP-binding protein [Pseudomonadota bacterium]